MTDRPFILTLTCIDRPAIVASVTGALAQLGANIAESSQFWDQDTGRFFMRIALFAPNSVGEEQIRAELAPVFERFNIEAKVLDANRPQNVLILVSKFDHALLHLLYQVRMGRVNANIVGLVSNHIDAQRIADQQGLPFHHLPVSKPTRANQERQLERIIYDKAVDLVVLARYMQILSNDFANRLSGRAINIHHSFLPSFKGARPYHQAHQRGVKLIGATAHYVTADLDEGPIIEQETVRVHHAMTPDDLIAEGRDIESRVLARAVKYHLEQRVMLNGSKTVVFN